MSNYLGTFKSNQTIYHDYNSDCIDFNKPDGKCGEDYVMLRKGTIFYAREIEKEKLGIEEKYNVILESNNGFWIYFENMAEVYKKEHLDEVYR